MLRCPGFVIWEGCIVVKCTVEFTDEAVASHSRYGCCQVRTACLHSFLRRGKLVVHAQHAERPALSTGMHTAACTRSGAKGREVGYEGDGAERICT